METGNVYYANHDGLVVFKFVGEVRYTMGSSYRISSSLDAYLDRLFESKALNHVLIDLTEALSIDSTNLGLLAKLTQFTQEHFGRKATIFSTNKDVSEILESVGFDQVFNIVHELHDPGVELEQLPEEREPDKALARLVLDAHKALIVLNDKNKDMFKDAVQMLEQEVGKEE